MEQIDYVNLKSIRENNKIVCFTNGCFDLIHVGHINIFDVAEKMGNILVVALNTDRSFKELKSKPPIFSLEEREYFLSRIKGIHKIITFDNEEELAEIIEVLDPDFIVKEMSTQSRESGSQALKRGTMVYVPPKYKYSSSDIIKKINENW